MPTVSRFTLRVTTTRAGRASRRASVEILIDCLLERVAQLIARRDTPREPQAPHPEVATPPPA